MSTYRRDRKPDSELVLEFRPAGAMAAQRFDVSEQGAEAQAWSEAYRQLRSALLATIWRPVSDPQVAEDLLHDVFAKAVRAMREGRAARNLAGWLHSARSSVSIPSPVSRSACSVSCGCSSRSPRGVAQSVTHTAPTASL